jgi:hypothetical protein
MTWNAPSILARPGHCNSQNENDERAGRIREWLGGTPCRGVRMETGVDYGPGRCVAISPPRRLPVWGRSAEASAPSLHRGRFGERTLPTGVRSLVYAPVGDIAALIPRFKGLRGIQSDAHGGLRYVLRRESCRFDRWVGVLRFRKRKRLLERSDLHNSANMGYSGTMRYRLWSLPGNRHPRQWGKHPISDFRGTLVLDPDLAAG